MRGPTGFQFFVSVTHLRSPSSSIRDGRGRPHSHVGSSVMPRATSRNFAFEVEHIHSMHKAFDAACARLELSTGTGDRLTELVASRIIELAMDGEWNAERLTARHLGRIWYRERRIAVAALAAGVGPLAGPTLPAALPRVRWGVTATT